MPRRLPFFLGIALVALAVLGLILTSLPTPRQALSRSLSGEAFLASPITVGLMSFNRDQVELRDKAGSDPSSQVESRLPKATQFHVLARTADSQWLRIETPDGTGGWVDADAVGLSSEQLNQIPVATTLTRPTDTPTPTPGREPTDTPVPPDTPTPPAPGGTPELTRLPATVQAANTPTPAPTIWNVAATTSAPAAIIEAEWPAWMEINRSDLIRVSLMRNAQQGFVAQVQMTGRSHTAVPATPIPVGTPSTSLEAAFGPDYEACATAELTSATFDYKAVAPQDCQALDQPELTWQWSIASKNKGVQNLVLTINAQWTSKTGKDVLKRLIWSYPVDIRVDEPLFTTGQINIASVAVGFLGSGISLKWLYDQRQARKPKGKATRSPKPKHRN